MNQNEGQQRASSEPEETKKHFRLFIGLARRDGGRTTVESVIDHLKQHLDAFTALEGIGYFSGECQASLVVECAVDEETTLLELARGLCVRFDQSSVGLASGDRYRTVSAPDCG